MKTDLSKILSVSGRHGLYRYVAQARGGVIAEALADGRRTAFDAHSKISSLGDIAIFTDDGELKLAEVFTALRKHLGDAEAPSAKAADEQLRTVFAAAIPNYDDTRFYVSHMRKVCEWYNELAKYASLDFESESEEN